jgi:uncharacterized RDD family membrane protein YckC
LQTPPARPAPESYASSFTGAAAATARALERSLSTSDAEAPPPPVAAAPQRPQVPRQTRLFTEGESSKVLPFPSQSKQPEAKPRTRRSPAQRQDSQAFLDFLPPAPHAPRTLKTSVEAVIYCDAPVATPTHRAAGFAIDFSLVVMAIGVFLLTFYLCGGEFGKINTPMSLGFGGAFLCVGLFYGILWALAGSETVGQRVTGLRLINFDGSPIDRRERVIRFAAACLSLCSAGLGLMWSLADEESLTWHDHMSKTFPTIRV